MNILDIRERLAALPSLKNPGVVFGAFRFGKSAAAAHAEALREWLDLSRAVMRQYATKALRPDCYCCTCNARRIIERLETELGPLPPQPENWT